MIYFVLREESAVQEDFCISPLEVFYGGINHSSIKKGEGLALQEIERGKKKGV